MCPVVLKSSRSWHMISFTSYKCKTSLCAWYQYDQLIFLISLIYQVQFSSVTQLCPTLCHPIDYSKPGFLVHHQLPRVHPNPCPLSQWCYPTISSSVISFSSCPQSFPASGSLPLSQLFASGGQSIGASASTSVLPMNTQDWSPLARTGWISLQSKGLSKFFFNTRVQKHQFSGAQLSL